MIDPFAGSNTTGIVAERLKRRWTAVELSEDYLRDSLFRFEPDAGLTRKQAAEVKSKDKAALMLFK